MVWLSTCKFLQQTLPPPQGLATVLLRKPQVASFEGGGGISQLDAPMFQRLDEHFLMVFELFFIKKLPFCNNKFFPLPLLWA